MKKKMPKAKKLCPSGVSDDCLYCVRLRGKVWEVLDPQDEAIDEASTQDEATDIADSFISQCEASKSGYGKSKQKRTPAAARAQTSSFNPNAGPFTYGR